MKSAVTISLVEEARGGPFVFWHDLPEACRTAKELGFDAIEIFPPSADVLDNAFTVVKRHELEVAAVGSGAGWAKHKLRLTDPIVETRQRAVDFISAIIQKAALADCPVIIGSMQGRWGDGVERDQALEWLKGALVKLAKVAEENGTYILFEPLNRYETNLFNRQTEAGTFIKSLGNSHVKLLCDLFHMNIEEAVPANVLAEVGPLLGHLHFADSNRQAVGFGHLDMAPIAKTLKAMNYSGFISAECLPLPDSRTAAKQTMQSFRRWFN
jgi:sugar phosphate isomerase/epimerase